MKRMLCFFCAVWLCCGVLALPSVTAEEAGNADDTPEGLTIASSRLTAAQTAADAYGARYSDSADDWWAEVRQEIVLRDDYVFPDRNNTGAVTDKENLTEFSEKYPEVEKRYYSRTWGGQDHSYTLYYITDETALRYQCCFEGFYAENAGFVFSNTTAAEVLMRNFRLDAGPDISCGIRTSLSDSQGRVYLCDGEMTGSVSALLYGRNITAIRCYLHDVWADHAKGFSGQQYVSCYFSRGGLNGGNPHPDCLQISGDDGHGGPLSVDDVLLYGNRIDAMPTSATVTNACIIIKSEFGAGLSNIRICRNWINGGNCPIQIGCAASGMKYYRDVAVSENLFGGSISATFSFTSAFADQLRSGDFSGNRKISTADVGDIGLYTDGQRLGAVGDVVPGSSVAMVTISNYSITALSGYIRVSLCDADGRVRDFLDTPFAAERLKNQQEAGKLSDFSYEDQPLDRVFSAPLPDTERQDGDFYTVSVVTLSATGAADILRSTPVLSAGTVPPHELTLPAGYLPVERNQKTPSVYFMNAVNRIGNLSGESRRQTLVYACALYNEADDTVYGVAAAKELLDRQLNSFNAEIETVDEAADNGFRILRQITSDAKKTSVMRALLYILCGPAASR